MKVLVTGGRGGLGRLTAALLEKRGHDVIVTSRTPRGAGQIELDLADGAGLPEAVRGVDAIVHLATGAAGGKIVDVDGTRRVLEAVATENPDAHFVYVSIVGVSDHPFVYYRAKADVEDVIRDSGRRWTILRATQFHDLIARYVEPLSWLPVLPVPASTTLQPIDPELVAERIVEIVEHGPMGDAPEMGGEERLDLVDMVRRYVRATGRIRLVVGVKYPGRAASAFRDGSILTDDRSPGGRTWGQWLATVPRKTSWATRALWAMGWGMLATAAWMALDPAGFSERIAAFGVYNEHFLHDLAAFSAPYGIGALIAARVPGWRRPVLTMFALQNGLHLVSHLVDVGLARSAAVAWGTVAAIAALQLVVVATMRGVRRQAA